MRNKQFNLYDGNWALPPNDLRMQTKQTARYKTKQPVCLLRSNVRAESANSCNGNAFLIGLQPNVHILGGEQDVGRSPTHLDCAQHV